MNIDTYTRLIFKNDGESNGFLDPWGGVTLRNVTQRGRLAKFKSMKEYKKSNTPLWVRCSLLIFKDQNYYPVYYCDICPIMSGIDSMSMNQQMDSIQQYKCIHSLMSEKFVERVGNFSDIWQLDFGDIEQQDQCHRVTINEHIEQVTLKDDDSFLALVLMKSFKSKVTILSSITSKTKKPSCINQCSTKPCKCLLMYRKLIEAAVEAQNPGEDVEPEHYWQRRKGPPKSVPNHYDEEDTVSHNHEKFQYPIFRDPNLLQKFQDHHLGNLNIPDELIPTWRDVQCRHGNHFDQRDENMIILSHEITIFEQSGETTQNTKVYGRKTMSSTCKCIMQPSGHAYLLWNLGNGMMISYKYLLWSLHTWQSGLPLSAQVKARRTSFENLRLQTSLTESDLNRGVMGKH